MRFLCVCKIAQPAKNYIYAQREGGGMQHIDEIMEEECRNRSSVHFLTEKIIEERLDLRRLPL